MPSKLGFGNSRTPMTKKVSYGSAMHYKNPVKNKTTKPKKKHHIKHTLLGKGLDIAARVPNLLAGAGADIANIAMFKGKHKGLEKFKKKQFSKAYPEE